jgi:transcriptional regulator with XRE-family HTH domain
MTSGRREQQIEALKDKEYRDLYVAEHIRTGIAFQIRAMREDRGWTQSELGQRAEGMAQETISQLEDPDYGRLTLRTLRRLASALDVALIVRFAAFSELLDWTLTLSPERLAVPGFDKDEHLRLTSISGTAALAPPMFEQGLRADDTREVDNVSAFPRQGWPTPQPTWQVASTR